METFSVELHSAALSELYPQNTFDSFTIFLPNQINLEGEWEVALVEICFPLKFCNLTEGSFGISVTKVWKVIGSEIYKLSPGYYPTKSFVSSMETKVVADSRFRNLHKMKTKFVLQSIPVVNKSLLKRCLV